MASGPSLREVIRPTRGHPTDAKIAQVSLAMSATVLITLPNQVRSLTRCIEDGSLEPTNPSAYQGQELPSAVNGARLCKFPAPVNSSEGVECLIQSLEHQRQPWLVYGDIACAGYRLPCAHPLFDLSPSCLHGAIASCYLAQLVLHSPAIRDWSVQP